MVWGLGRVGLLPVGSDDQIYGSPLFPRQSFMIILIARSTLTEVRVLYARCMCLAQRIRVCELTGSFQLRSGQLSSTYFDKYLFEADPVLLREVAGVMVSLLPSCEVLAAMEMGGIPIAVVMSQLTGLHAVFVREEAKTYGTCKAVEGGSVAGRTAVLVEDVVTTGGALLHACAELRRTGAVVDTVVCAIDREQGARANLATMGLTLYAALTRTELEAGGEDGG